MSFDYDRIRSDDHHQENHWISYSDLFTMLSVVFLLLYVTASLRSGSFGVQKNKEYQKLAKEAEDLKQQIKVYNTLKDDYLQNQASEDEQEVYTQLMDKLSLLQDQAHDEKEALRQKAKENEKKEFALNKYQQIIRNIINTNMLAKQQITRRDKLITTKDAEIMDLNRSVAEKEQVISENNNQIEQINHTLEKRIQDMRNAQQRARSSEKVLNQAISKLKAESEQRIGSLKQQNQLTQQQLSAVKSDLESKLQQAHGALAQTAGALEATKGKLSQAEQSANRAIATAEGLKKENGMLAGDLQRARELANAKKNLAEQIKQTFGAAGIKADVDEKTGEVTLSFGDDYFTTGRAELTPTMKATLKRLMPAYARSLFKDSKTADKIANVEIVGYASSTFKGKYVNPQSLKPEDQEAINYNLRLSFSRANAIFKYVFDTKQLSFKDQKRLLPMVKVVGRGYLPEGKQGKDVPDGLPEKEFCRLYNCEKAQRVIIKFNLKD